MKLSKVKVLNFRNLKCIDISLNRITILIGENNSGKSNLLKAITLPFLNDEVGNLSKKLGWHDINNSAKEMYFNFLKTNKERIANQEINLEEFIKIVPIVTVDVSFSPDGSDEYYIHKWITAIDEEVPQYSIQYKYAVQDHQKLLELVTNILITNSSIDNIKMNLLPIEFYKYTIQVPLTEDPVSFSDLNNFKYNSLAAERDDFSIKNNQLGSRALVNLLQNKLSDEQKVAVEKSYEDFFSDLKHISKLEGVFNWQEDSALENAKDFFKEITLLPNMPSMGSLLNNLRLGFGEEYLNTQGLGYRNLIYLLVMINSLKVHTDSALNILTIEEPEAHLCVSNEHLLASFFNSILNSSSDLQLFLSTHSTEFINKLELQNVVVLANGSAFSLKDTITLQELNYLAKKPNLDFLKFLFSRNCILVEGPTEEMLIKAYLSSNANSLYDIEVIALHKGFTKMLDIWLKINQCTTSRIGIIRDFDDQPNAQINHERYNEYSNIYVTTTTEYTLEPEFVKTSTNFKKMNEYFTQNHGWEKCTTPEELSELWRSAKASTMLRFCRDFGKNELTNIVLPKHIANVLEFLKSGEKK
ncbi:AAA family ATPase [Paenibacillus taichungensis]|uniref:ATP-dependent nuclease n=1 Tax=Paenibacillus TaxID=44249 RepID=UPI000C19F8C0|nr:MULTISPECIES: AAA family ATPase [Paenibacillus]MEC0107367.1 AAA family ATPase [Paenibacillus taichungensis]MEC0195561.1 AAA family ATPase [Paenibacillus taichungensis]PIH60282.1 hypothetical protein CS562_04030 [Paenibacillus sp. LK1]